MPEWMQDGRAYNAVEKPDWLEPGVYWILSVRSPTELFSMSGFESLVEVRGPDDRSVAAPPHRQFHQWDFSK